MSKVTVSRGVEGPSYDPYDVHELMVRRPSGVVVVVHEGLGTWIKAYHVERPNVYTEHTVCSEKDVEFLNELFAQLVGASLRSVKRAYYAMRERARQCCRGRTRTMRGLPGESLTLCADCDRVVDCEFNESEVM